MTQEAASRPIEERPAAGDTEFTETIVGARADEVNAPAPRSGDENRTWKTWHFSPYELFVLGQPVLPEGES